MSEEGQLGIADAAKLRALLRATELITSDLSPERVLGHIAEAACELAGARHAAIAVIAPDGSFEEIVHAGADDEAPAHLEPAGNGERIAVPVQIRGEVFGNLYVSDSRDGGFSAEDEELVSSLAFAAGSAIANARRYQESRLQQRWLSASVDIAAQLLASTGENPLQTIARYAKDIADADLVSVGVITPDGGNITVEVAIGFGADQIAGRTFPLAGALAGRSITERAPLLVRSPTDIADAVPVMATEIDAGPIMIIPLIGAGEVIGAMNIVRRVGGAVFRQSDLDMAAGFASHASLAIELARVRSDQQRMALLEDRDRIARDLHDHVIQQLFAVGLSLQGLAALAADMPEIARPLEDRVDDIDRTIRQIRTSIFQLRGPLLGTGAGLRAGVLQVVAELTQVLGFAPAVTFAGPVDTLTDEELAHDIKACVREGLTNVAKYARATQASVDVMARGGAISVRVIDDGIGMDASGAYSGLRNLRRRAERRGGSFEVRTPPDGGTELVWEAPTA
jgi:signal transduction histidine kinase